MTVRASTLVFVAVAGLAGFVPLTTVGDDAAQPVDDTAHWITQLASESFIQRDFAGRQLLVRGADAVPLLTEAVRGNDETAARTAINLLLQLALSDDNTTAASAHRVLAVQAMATDSMTESLRPSITAALRRAERHAASIVTALGGSVERDDTLSIVAIKVDAPAGSDAHVSIVARLAQLQRLDLRNTGITDDSLKIIATLSMLKELNLSDTAVTGAGLKQLSRLTRLEKLSLYRIPMSSAELHWLKEQLPDCDLRR